MKISKVRLLTTLKCGPQVWVKGKILRKPIPDSILSEIRQVTGTIEVLEGSGYLTEPPKIKPRSFTADTKPRGEVVETLTAEPEVEPRPKAVRKRILLRRPTQP